MFNFENRTVWHDIKLAGTFGFLGGYVSILSLMNFGILGNCLSGDATRTALTLAQLDYKQAFTFFLVIVFFILGGWISAIFFNYFGFLNRLSHMLVLVLEGTLLLLIGMQQISMPYAIWAVAISMGMQNGLTSCISRAVGRIVVRTTHITGNCTDIGILLANKDLKSAGFFGAILVFYLIGAVAGSVAFKLWLGQSFIFGAFIVYGVLVYETVLNFITNKFITNHKEKTKELKEASINRAT